MKHFTITTQEQAEALRPFSSTPKLPLKVGHIIVPSAGDYPESDAITFEQCMSIVKDEVTEELLRELGDIQDSESSNWIHVVEGKSRIARSKEPPNRTYLYLQDVDGGRAMTLIPNPTATKIRLLTSILRGQ